MHTIRTERGEKIHEEIDPPQFAYPVGARDPYCLPPEDGRIKDRCAYQ